MKLYFLVRLLHFIYNIYTIMLKLEEEEEVVVVVVVVVTVICSLPCNNSLVVPVLSDFPRDCNKLSQFFSDSSLNTE
jgi:hypothetical protein